MHKLIIILLFILLLTTCTQMGVESGLIGSWELDSIEYDSVKNLDEDETRGYLYIHSNSTYDMELTYKFKDNSPNVKSIDYGTLKACSVNRWIQFFSEKNDHDWNASYKIEENTLTITTSYPEVILVYKRF